MAEGAWEKRRWLLLILAGSILATLVIVNQLFEWVDDSIWP